MPEVEDKLARLPLRYFGSHPHGDVLSRVTNDIDNAAELVLGQPTPRRTNLMSRCSAQVI